LFRKIVLLSGDTDVSYFFVSEEFTEYSVAGADPEISGGMNLGTKAPKDIRH